MRSNDMLSDFVESTVPDQLFGLKSGISIFSLFDNGRKTYEGEILRTLFNDDGFMVLLKKVDEELYEEIRRNSSRGDVYGSLIVERMKVIALALCKRIQDEIAIVLSLPGALEYCFFDRAARLIRRKTVSKKLAAVTLQETLLLHERNGCLVSNDFRKVTRAGLIRIHFCRWTLVYLFLTRKEQKEIHEQFVAWLHTYSLSKK